MIFQQFQTIEWMIVQEIIRLLTYEQGETLSSWANRRSQLVDELVEFIVATLSASRPQIVEAVESDVQAAFELISEHIRIEFGEEIEIDQEHVNEVLGYLNRDVMHALPETVEETYLSVIEHVQESEITGDRDLETVISTILLEDLQNGLKSGFIQADGKQWGLSRTVSHIEKRIYLDEYNHAWEHLRFLNIEVVRVHHFENPRDACYGLQESGLIAIKPRGELSESSKTLPNIWDPVHKYMEIDGHHGIHCRHAWHHPNSSENRMASLYAALDDLSLAYELFKEQLRHMVERYV